jgi:hypothetical protein
MLPKRCGDFGRLRVSEDRTAELVELLDARVEGCVRLFDSACG